MEPLQACETDERRLRQDRSIVGPALRVLFVMVSQLQGFEPEFGCWAALTGSDSLQQYAIEALAQAPPRGLSAEQLAKLPPADVEPFGLLLSFAANAGKISFARTSALVMNAGIAARLRAIAEGEDGFHETSVLLLVAFTAAWDRLNAAGHAPTGSAEEMEAAQSAMMAVLRQGSSLLQLHRMGPASHKRALRRAQRGGFYRVCLPLCKIPCT